MAPATPSFIIAAKSKSPTKPTAYFAGFTTGDAGKSAVIWTLYKAQARFFTEADEAAIEAKLVAPSYASRRVEVRPCPQPPVKAA